MKCPCCSGNDYVNCCEPYHKKIKNAPTAEALMRSRYAAFAFPNGDYLISTTLPTKRKFHDKQDLEEWGNMNTWVKLEIVSTPAPNRVHFKAFYIDENGNAQIQEERSVFQKIGDKWFYVSGEFIE